MRLSDSIAMGRFVVKAIAGGIGNEDGGCALNMAAVASGLEISPAAVTIKWPWLMSARFKFPCSCSPMKICNVFPNGYGIVAHLFDDHVMDAGSKYDPWTLDQLIDWVRSVEPAEPEEAVNQETYNEMLADVCS